MTQHTLQQQIDAVAREIKMREYVYPSRVANKKMKQEKADYEIAVMKSIAATLVGLQAVDPNNAGASAKAQVCMDLHAALGVEWGGDPYARIRRLIAALKWADDATAYLYQPKDKQTFEGVRKLLDAVPTFRPQDNCNGNTHE